MCAITQVSGCSWKIIKLRADVIIQEHQPQEEIISASQAEYSSEGEGQYREIMFASSPEAARAERNR